MWFSIEKQKHFNLKYLENKVFRKLRASEINILLLWAYRFTVQYIKIFLPYTSKGILFNKTIKNPFYYFKVK